MRLAAAATLSLLLLGTAAAEEFRGRGVYYFSGSVKCPLAGVGTRGANDCNRVALDDDFSSVEVDRDAHRILWTNTHSYPKQEIVGDLTFVAIGQTAKGERVPVGIHFKVSKKGNRLSSEIHPHPTVRASVEPVELEPFEVVLANGRESRIALDADGMRSAVREPEVAARLANLFIQVTDNLEGVALTPSQPDAALVDLAVGVGVEQVNLKVARIELRSLDPANAPLIEKGDLSEMFRRGSWQMRITSLTPFLPREEFSRDFFLLGLDQISILRPVSEHGLRKGESLVIGYRDGAGFIGLGTATAEIPNPVDVARAFLEFNFVGGLMARQVAGLPAKMR